MTSNEFHIIEQKKLKNRIEILENVLSSVRSKILGGLTDSDVHYLTDLIDRTLEK